MPVWLWVVVAVAVVLGVVYLALLPQRRLRRDLADGRSPLPSRDARRAEATAIDPQPFTNRPAGPNQGYGPS